MILAILQARCSSSRLPGKVLKTILGKPMLALQLEREKRSQRIDRFVVATSTDLSDDPLVELCELSGVPVFRGSLDDVLDRFYNAALPYRPDYVVRLTGDCPLADPEGIDRLIEFCISGKFDYASNSLEPTLPDGLDAEVFRFTALEEAWREASLPSQREHVTPFIYSNGDRFRIGSLKEETNLSHLRWTVDEPEDFDLISIIYETLYVSNPEFTTADVLTLLERRPELKTWNTKHRRNEGFEKSLNEDRKVDLREKMKKSLACQERGKVRIPGLTQLLSKRPDMFSMGVWPGYFDRASGVEVWDLDGNRYIDMSIGGIGANVLGYCDPDVDTAVMDAIRRGTSSSLNCPEEVDLAELLCETHTWAEKARFTRAGGESMVVAVRIARAATGRDKVAFCGYHGWHDWYLAANVGTENALGEHLIAGLKPTGVPKALAGTALPFNFNRVQELKDLVHKHRGELAAIVLEPVRNDNPTPEFVTAVRELADEAGAVLIVDEISSGFRMNSGGAHLVLGYDPDIAVFSKALGNGYPIGAIIGKGKVMDAAQTSFISSTYWTERIGPVAALATIRKHRAVDAGPHLMKIGGSVQAGWKSLSERHRLPIHVGGIPPLSHFSFDGEEAAYMKAYFIQLMLERGFLASSSFYSMYAHTEEHVRLYLESADAAFAEIRAAIDCGDLKNLLAGAPSASGFKRLN